MLLGRQANPYTQHKSAQVYKANLSSRERKDVITCFCLFKSGNIKFKQ